MDVQDLPYYVSQRCKLFLWERDDGTDDSLDLKLHACDTVPAPYELDKPMYRVCTRNFTNLLDEIEKVDYNFEVDMDDSSDEEEYHRGQDE